MEKLKTYEDPVTPSKFGKKRKEKRTTSIFPWSQTPNQCVKLPLNHSTLVYNMINNQTRSSRITMSNIHKLGQVFQATQLSLKSVWRWSHLFDYWKPQKKWFLSPIKPYRQNKRIELYNIGPDNTQLSIHWFLRSVVHLDLQEPLNRLPAYWTSVCLESQNLCASTAHTLHRNKQHKLGLGIEKCHAKECNGPEVRPDQLEQILFCSLNIEKISHHSSE